MQSMNTSTEVILQKAERVSSLVLDPQYGNMRISPRMDYSVSQQKYPCVAVDPISNKIWHLNLQIGDL